MSRLKLRILEAGHSVHPEHVILQNRSLKLRRFPALYAVLEHAQHGLSLFDTGYSQHFSQATRPFPERLYAWTTPVTIGPEHTALSQLARLGYDARDVRQVFISHFHADHVSALADFPRAQFRYWPEAFEAISRLGRIAALRGGILPALLPQDFQDRSVPLRGHGAPLPDSLRAFGDGLDVFGDGSCWALRLPGHARGQLGLVIRNTDDQRVFLIADACWTREGFERRQRPHRITHLLFDDAPSYYATIDKLADLHLRDRELHIVPSHCAQTFASLRLG